MTRDPRFNEVGRGGEPWGGNFLELRREYVDGHAHPGWEPHDLAAERFDAGVADFQRLAAGRPVAIATHGMILTAWLVSRGVMAAGGAGDFWSSLRFPDCIEVRPDGGSTIAPSRLR